MSQLRDYIDTHPESAKRLVGLDYSRLIELISHAKKLQEEQKKARENKKTRIIKAGGGRKPKLSGDDQILLTLVYLHNLPTFQMLGVQFGVSESAANYIFHYWLGILRELLPASLIEQGEKNDSDAAWVSEILAEIELIVDSYEQPRLRPTASEEQKKFYSGKQKRHTLKNQVIVMPSGQEIVDIIAGEPGKTSDINIWRSRCSSFSETQKFQGDKAYVGDPRIDPPQKKPRNQVLTDKVKQSNKKKARRRVVVEHVIRLIKTFRIAAERFRLNPDTYNRVIMTVCGLIRWRIGALVIFG